jgi:hypothetical protein
MWHRHRKERRRRTGSQVRTMRQKPNYVSIILLGERRVAYSNKYTRRDSGDDENKDGVKSSIRQP